MKPIGVARLQNVIEAQRNIMAGVPDMTAVMQTTAKWARLLTGGSGGVIELADGEDMVYRAGCGSASGMQGMRLKIESSLSGLCVRERQMLYAEDTEIDPRVDREACRRVNARSMMVVPLFHRDRCVGVLKVLAPIPSAFDADDMAVLELMTGLIGFAMGHAAAHDALLASETRFRKLAEMAHDAIITLDRAGHITFFNRGAERLLGYQAQAVLDMPIDQIMPEVDIKGLQVRLHPSVIPGIRHVSASQPSLTPLLDHTVELSARCADGSTVQVELVVSAWRANGTEQFTAVARDIRERKRRHAEAIDRLRVDSLTGLLVRRAGLEALRLESERARRHRHPYSVVMLDLDHFKRVNDHFGHNAGDQILERVGDVVRESLRDSDIAVRWGGEELLLLLAETSLEGAAECAERIRQEVALLEHPEVGRVTLSAGVSTCGALEALEAVIARADERLYAAKDMGRNRVCQ